MLAKKKQAEGRQNSTVITLGDQCSKCHVKIRYGLPCVHDIPSDGTPVKIEQIRSLWLLSNWSEGNRFLYKLHTNIAIESIITPLVATQNSQSLPSQNIQLEEIERSVSINSLVDHPSLLRSQLNETARNDQTVYLEEKFLQLNEKYLNASDAIRARILHDVQQSLETLVEEQHKVDTIQDPPSMRGRRTHGRGGQRIQSGGERADKELRELQKEAERETRHNLTQRTPSQPTQIPASQPISIVSSQQPMFMTFNSSSGEIIVQSQELSIVTAGQTQKRQNGSSDSRPSTSESSRRKRSKKSTTKAR